MSQNRPSRPSQPTRTPPTNIPLLLCVVDWKLLFGMCDSIAHLPRFITWAVAPVYAAYGRKKERKKGKHRTLRPSSEGDRLFGRSFLSFPHYNLHFTNRVRIEICRARGCSFIAHLRRKSILFCREKKKARPYEQVRHVNIQYSPEDLVGVFTAYRVGSQVAS